MSRLTTEPFSSRVSTNGAGPTDIDLLRSLRWNAGAKHLAGAARRGDSAAFARDLRRDWAGRFGRKFADSDRLAARFPGYEAEARAEYARFVERSGAVLSPATTTHALVRTAALLDGLRRFGASLEPKRLWSLWREAWLHASDVTGLPVSESPLDRVLAAEIGWTSGILFAGIAEAHSRRKAGRKAILAEFDARTDNDGTPHGELLPILPAWFASLTRSVAWAKAGDVRLWDSAFSGRFDGLLRTVTVLAHPDGRLALGRDGDVRPVLREAVKRSGWKTASPVRRLVSKLRESESPTAVPSRESVPRRFDRKSPPIVQSDWAKLVVSRTRWRPEADAVIVAHGGRLPAIEFAARGHVVFSGEWGLRITVDGEEIQTTPDWEAVSWFSDGEADYLELQWPNDRGVTVCRQLLLTRGDHQLVIADSLSAPGRNEARIEVESTLPLARGVKSKRRPPSRELRLEAAGLALRAFPIAFPSERIEGTSGSFEEDAGDLVMNRAGVGGVYLPIVFDWHPKRREAFADWRTLTVTEDRRRLGPAEASGHRLRIGGRQLLVYRAMNGSKAKRTILGYHHGNESVIGRFTEDGEVEPLVLVE